MCFRFLLPSPASIATDSTLCAGSTQQQQQQHPKQTARSLSSQKSNISTLTRDDIDLNLPAEEQMCSIEVNNNNTATLKDSFVTTVEIEHEPNTNLPQFTVNKGVDNRAYEHNEDEAKRQSSVPKGHHKDHHQVQGIAAQNAKSKQGQVNLNFGSPLQQQQQQNRSMSRSSSSASSYYEGFSEDDLSDVSTTIIDGKRAISLSNFGKYAAHQQKRFNNAGAMTGPIYGYQLASAGFRAHKSVASK